MERLQKFYWILLAVTSLEILNLIFRFIPQYYGTRIFLLLLALVITWFGIELGKKRVLVIILGIILVFLSVLMLFVVWN